VGSEGFDQARLEVPGGHQPESAIRKHLQGVGTREAPQAVALALEGQCPIRVCLDGSVDSTSDVDAQEWQA